MILTVLHSDKQYVHTHTQRHILMHTCARTHTHTYSCTHAHTHTHTCTHTNTHTYAQHSTMQSKPVMNKMMSTLPESIYFFFDILLIQGAQLVFIQHELFCIYLAQSICSHVPPPLPPPFPTQITQFFSQAHNYAFSLSLSLSLSLSHSLSGFLFLSPLLS